MLVGLAVIAAAVAVISKWPDSPVNVPADTGGSTGSVESPPSTEILWDDGVDQDLEHLNGEVETLLLETVVEAAKQ